MITMSSDDKPNVWINGKLVTLEELQEQFKAISIAGVPSNLRIMEVLSKAKKPLTRQDVAKEVKMTTSYTTTLLKRLVKEELVLEFDMEKSNFKYYLLTEKGYNLIKK